MVVGDRREKARGGGRRRLRRGPAAGSRTQEGTMEGRDQKRGRGAGGRGKEWRPSGRVEVGTAKAGGNNRQTWRK